MPLALLLITSVPNHVACHFVTLDPTPVIVLFSTFPPIPAYILVHIPATVLVSIPDLTSTNISTFRPTPISPPGGPNLHALATAGVVGAGVGFVAAPAIGGVLSGIGKK